MVLKSELDIREEIEHHLEHLDAHFIAVKNNKIIGVIGRFYYLRQGFRLVMQGKIGGNLKFFMVKDL